MADAHHDDIKAHVRQYMMVFGSLMVLTVVTVGVSYMHLSIGYAVILALIIASVKATLVAGYFMHLISERKAIYGLLILTAIFFVALMGLPLWHHADPIV